MKLTQEMLEEYRKVAFNYELKGRALLLTMPDDKIMEIANGIGPACFPESIRNVLDNAHPSMKIPSVIHDVRFYNGSGTREDFEGANEDFVENCKTMAKNTYGWYNPVRYLAIRKANQFGVILNTFGWDAYLSAIEERKAAENE